MQGKVDEFTTIQNDTDHFEVFFNLRYLAYRYLGLIQIISGKTTRLHFCIIKIHSMKGATTKYSTTYTLISNPKAKFLLGAGLDVLHQESHEWLDTIAFWKDETKFFGNILEKREVKESEYGKMLNYLDKIHENLFDYLTEDIRDHERLLSRLEKGEKGIADGDYREEHKRLSESMVLFENDFREFKKMVFGYVKKL
jgi:hypothetical protein